MKDWQANQRPRALIVGTLLYTAVRAGFPKEAIDSWLPQLFPDVAAMVGPGGSRAVQALLEALGLATAILLVEATLLRISARELLGRWVYHSSAGNWGDVRIWFEFVRGRLRYRVDLYESEEALLAALKGEDVYGWIGHGSDRFAFQDQDATKIWYHVPEYRTEKRHYPQREGVLALIQTNQPGRLMATWSRLGGLASAAVSSATNSLGQINAQDQAHASGSFEFFIRRKLYMAGKVRGSSRSSQ
jgi:hypothetical protein